MNDKDKLQVVLSLNEYQNKAMSFRLPSASPMYAVLNLAGEVGELTSLIAKAIRDNPKDDHEEQMKKELGDCLWHIAAIAIDNGFSLREVAQANIDKLSSRKERNVLQGAGDNR